MNISTLAKILGVSLNELRDTGVKQRIRGFQGRNTRIPYESALEVTKILRPDKLKNLKNDDKIYLPATLTVGEFAETIGKPVGLVVKTLLMNGVMATLNEKIDYDTASLVAEELRVDVYPEDASILDEIVDESELQMMKTFEVSSDSATLVTRPPVVTVMGHVDHGKTTLLDTIRKTNVVADEAGAITQHIASYQIQYQPQEDSFTHLIKGSTGYKITFVDTPGHEAFTAMRARGTQLADIIILMVSATEGPKPQTIEVIERAKLSKTPLIVAINKIDLPNADIEKTKTDIAAFGIVPEEWGGETAFIPVSAKKNENIETILNTILLMAEVSELTGQSDGDGQGVVIESVVDKQMGAQSTVLITKSSLSVGDFVAAGEMVGKIKRITNSEGKAIQTAELAEPVSIFGLPSITTIGDFVTRYSSKKEAEKAVSIEKLKQQKKRKMVVRDDGKETDTLNVILKADVSGSLEALKESILKIPQEQTKIVIKHDSVGNVTETDINFAATTGSTILAFHTNIENSAEKVLKKDAVNLIQSNIIYEILEWLEEQLLKRIKHEVRIDVLGWAEVLATFSSDKKDIHIFGGEVKDGKILYNKHVRLKRDEEEVCIMEIVDLQKQKASTKEVNISQQFGISTKVISGKKGIKVKKGDILESIDEVVIQ